MPETHIQREELIFLLDQAAELEHSLACSYLFTAFSLKLLPDEGVDAEMLQTVRRWKREFSSVAVEEMFHLAVVTNLLTALGAAPHYDRPNFPHDCAYYLPEYQIGLHPFNKETLHHFIAIEQPDGSNLPAAMDSSKIERVEGDLDNEIGPDPEQFDSQGDVYTAVESGLRDMVARLGEDNVFIGPPPNAALRSFFESNGWAPVTDLASTQKALERIVTEGEGAKSSDVSHFARFNAILGEYEALLARLPDFAPGRPVVANPFTRTPPEGSGPVNLIEDKFAIQVSDLFNESYGVMLQLLGRVFVADDETEAEATALLDASIDVMTHACRPLGELLTRLPAGPSHPGMTAGPSFALRTVHALPHKAAARRMLRERLQELSAYTQALSAENPEARSLEAVARRLTQTADTLVV
jgi:hypothetical protein